MIRAIGIGDGTVDILLVETAVGAVAEAEVGATHTETRGLTAGLEDRHMTPEGRPATEMKEVATMTTLLVLAAIVESRAMTATGEKLASPPKTAMMT